MGLRWQVYVNQAKTAKTLGTDDAKKATSKFTSFTKTDESQSAEAVGAKLQKRMLNGEVAPFQFMLTKMLIMYLSTAGAETQPVRKLYAKSYSTSHNR